MVVLSAALTMGACSPEPESTVPTKTIVIKNIPPKIKNTASQNYVDDHIGYDNTKEKDTFKVYLQLSAGMTADAGYAAMGEALISEAEEATDGTYTVTINLEKPKGTPWSGDNWANESVIISPETVDDIFEIDVKVGMIGPSTSSSTVVFNWNGLLEKKKMELAPGGNTIENYKRLYGNKSVANEGVIMNDIDIGGLKNNPPANLKWDDFK